MAPVPVAPYWAGTRPSRMPGARWSIGNWTVWSVMLLLAIGVAGYALSGVLRGIEVGIPAMAYHLPERAVFAAMHFGIGGVALLVGPFQFVPAVRARMPVLHRWLGRIYVAACLLSGGAGFVLASNTSAGPIARTGFSLLAIFWILTTGMAFARARQRNFAEHKRWMIRSFALTLAAVTLRIYLPVSAIFLKIEFVVAYPVIAFACWVPNVIVAEWLVRKR